MKTFKTPKGTDLPFVSIKGKDYLQVAHRLIWFREEHPDWGIKTKLEIDFKEKRCVAFAEITNAEGRVIATAHKIEDIQGFPDYSEKSETSAIGRALALCGYGTQFAQELDEGDRIVDSPVIPTIKRTQLPSGGVITKEVPDEKPKREDLNRKLMWLYKPYISAYPHTVWKTLLKDRYNVEESSLMTVEQIQDLINLIEKRLAEGQRV